MHDYKFYGIEKRMRLQGEKAHIIGLQKTAASSRIQQALIAKKYTHIRIQKLN
jgi:hypothetical protein